MASQKDYTSRRVYQSKPITLARAFGYGVVDLMGGGWNTIISGLMLYFFTQYGNVSVVQSGSILLIARVVDAVVSLLIGPLSDNFYRTKLGQKYGRRHFFLLVCAPLMFLIFPLLWIPGRGYFYYLFVYLAIEIIIAMVLIPWETLPTEMTSDYNKRTKLSSTRMFLSATGTSLVFALPAYVKHNYPNSPYVFLIVGGSFAVLFAAAILITYFTTWEHKLTPEFLKELESRPKMTVGQTLKHTVKESVTTFKNKAFVKHLTIYLLSFTGKDMYATALTFFVVYTMHLQEDFGYTLQALSFIGIPVTVACGFIMIRKGPRFLWSVSFTTITLALLATGAVYLLHLPTDNAIVWLIVINLFYQSGRAILEFTPWNVYPFIPDVDYIMSRENRAGAYAAVMTFGRKSTGAVATFLVSWMLDLGGFIKTEKLPEGQTWDQVYPGLTPIFDTCNPTTTACQVVQSPHTQGVIAAVTVFAPMLLIVLALIVSRFFHLDSSHHAILKKETQRLEAGGSKADVDPESRKVVEDLTGHRYEDLWPDTPWSQRV